MCFFFAVFQSAPPLPPSSAQAAQRAAEQASFFASVKRLATNPGYILLLISYGINVGVFYAISTLLNQVVLVYFPVKFLKIFLALKKSIFLMFWMLTPLIKFCALKFFLNVSTF